MICDVGGVGVQENTEEQEGGAHGMLGENELLQLETQVILIGMGKRWQGSAL